MPIFYDVFNGDADGICALHQLRLNEPRDSVLISGAKRDIDLLKRVDARVGDELTVLDISLARNRDDLQRNLEHGARCRYFDHHYAGAILQHPNLTAMIDTAPDICTSLLVDRYLNGRRRIWAVVAAFGDGLPAAAQRAAADLRLTAQQLAQLQHLGECINYNAYGDNVEDLNYHPADLYQTLHRYESPFDFIAGEPVFDILRNAHDDDLFCAEECHPQLQTRNCAMYMLPDAAWSRRINGSFGNRLSACEPDRAHAILTPTLGGYRVSVRAPHSRPRGAHALCAQFGGGGRDGAAGIDGLPPAQLERFIAAFKITYGQDA